MSVFLSVLSTFVLSMFYRSNHLSFVLTLTFISNCPLQIMMKHSLNSVVNALCVSSRLYVQAVQKCMWHVCVNSVNDVYLGRSNDASFISDAHVYCATGTTAAHD